MGTTIGCPIPGASQPKEPVRLIDIKEVLQYDGAHFAWSGGRNCLSEQKAAYARGYNAGMKFIVDEVKKAPTIDPEFLQHMARWISVKDRLPEVRLIVLAYAAPTDGIHFAFRERGSENFVDCGSGYYLNTVTHWMPLPAPPRR